MKTSLGRLAASVGWAALLAVGFAVGCSDSTAPRGSSGPDVDAKRQIIDAGSGGTSGFYFLSPIATSPTSYPGTFDPSRSPVVEICQPVNGVCGPIPVVSYSGAAIQLSTTGEYYRTNWPMSGVATGVTYRIRVLENGVELGHADARKPASGESATSLRAQDIVPLGNSGSFAIRFRLEVPPANTAPVVSIASPADGAIVSVSSPVSFAGSANDAEDGDISNHLVWRSSKVVDPLGVGGSVSASLPGGRQTITASVTDEGGSTSTASIQLVVSIVSVPATLNVPYGGTASLPITLSEPAPAGGITFDVTSSDPHVGVSTTTVSIPAGSQAANATLQGAGPGSATITVSNADYGSASAAVSTTADLNIVQRSVSVPESRTQDITIELKSAGSSIAAPAGGLQVDLVPANPGCAAITSPVTIPAGLVSTTATISYGGSASTPCSTKVTASAAGMPEITSDNVDVTIQVSPTLSFTMFGGTRVGSGLRQANATRVNLGAPAPAGGVTVTLTSGDPSLALVAPSSPSGSVAAATASVNVAAGNTIADFYVDGVDGATGTVTFTATATGYSSATSGTVTVAGLAVRFSNVPSSTTTLSANSNVSAQLGVLDATGTTMGAVQDIRPGGSPRTITFTSSDPAVGTLATSALNGATVTATIAVGESSTPSSLASGGVQFDPQGDGTTTLAVTGAGLTPVATSSKVVTVSAPAMTFTLFGGTRVGAGLRQANATRVTLGAPAPAGGVAVTLASSDPAVALVAPSAAAASSGSATVTVPAGSSSADFYVDGVDGTAGTATFTATATDYTTATSPAITVAGLAVQFSSVPTSTTTLSANSAISARIGVLNAAGTGMGAVQAIRPGSAARVVTFSSDDPAVGQLVTSTTSGATATATIAVGESNTPTPLASGGVQFKPLGEGTATLTVAGSGLTAVSNSSQAVTVTAPALSFTLFGGNRVGAGLRQANVTRVQLATGAPAGGVTVTLSSSDPSVALVSPSGGGSPASSASVTVAAGGASADFYVDGVDGAAGSVTLTAVAPAYTSATTSITVAGVGVQFSTVPSSTTTLAPNSNVGARIGVLNATGTGLSAVQPIRPGGSARTITFTNSNAGVGQLATSATSGQAVTATIDVGASATPTTIAGGGVQFDPLGAGSTTLEVSGTGLTAVPTSSQVVTVTAPTISITQFGGARVGAGLRQANVTRVQLGAAAPTGGVIVTLASSAPGVALVAPSGPGSIAGTASAQVTVPQGSSSADFYVDGVEGAAGTVTLTASAGGYTNGTTTVTTAGVALRLGSAPTSISAGASNATVTAQIGVLDAAGTGMSAVQEIRPGGAALTFTFTNSDASRAQLVTSATTGQSVTASIGVGQDTSPSTLAAGGVQFDPLGAGTSTLSVSGGGAVAISTASRVVTINP